MTMHWSPNRGVRDAMDSGAGYGGSSLGSRRRVERFAQPSGQTGMYEASLLARGRLASLDTRLLLLRGSAALLRAGIRARFLPTAAGGTGTVGDAGSPGLRHALVLQLLVLFLVLDIGGLRAPGIRWVI